MTNNSFFVYPNDQGENPLELCDENRIARGGQGAVYGYTVNTGEKRVKIAFKVFDRKQLENRQLRDKIARMAEIGKKDGHALINHRMVAWPQLVIYDQKGDFIGYAMKCARGKSLRYVAHKQNSEKYFPDMDREKVARMLIGVWETADMLHSHGIYIGDVNLGNVLCDENYQPCLIDMDSCQVEKWRCPVGRPEMTPPEHLGGNYEKIDRNRESDIFSLAVLTFQCLMQGRHPYEYIGGGSPVENQKEGRIPYLTGSGAPPGKRGGVPIGPYYAYWDNYPRQLKTLFERALRSGAKAPDERASAEEWIRGLRKYIEQLNKPAAKTRDGRPFQHTKNMRPTAPKPKGLIPIERSDNIPESTPVVTSDDFSISVGSMIDNPTPRCPVALVLDTSDNMQGEIISGLNGGVKKFIADIRGDDFTRYAVELEIFTVGGEVKSYFNFTEQDQLQWNDVTASGPPLVADGMVAAVESLKQRQAEYTAQGISSYLPWLVLITGSAPHVENHPAWRRIYSENEQGDKIRIFAVGAGSGYNPDTLSGYAYAHRPPRRLKAGRFCELFDWLTQNLQAVSDSVPGYCRKLLPTHTWAE